MFGTSHMPRGRPASQEKAYHLALAPGELPGTVLVPGDPDRVERIVASWENAEQLARKRQFFSARGRYRGTPLGVVSSGIGGPAMAITVEELARLGVRTIIRVGSCGGIASGTRRGDLVITRAAVRFDSASRDYVPAGYPASADPEVYLALMGAAERLGFRHRGGLTASFDTFYVGQGRPGFGGFLPAERRRVLPELRAMRVVNIEMECATLLTLGNLYGLRAGAVCAVYDTGPRDRLLPQGDERSIAVANEAAWSLARPPSSSRAARH